MLTLLDGLFDDPRSSFVHVLAAVPAIESRLFPLGMGHWVGFASERVASFASLSTTNWAFEVNCIHVHTVG